MPEWSYLCEYEDATTLPPSAKNCVCVMITITNEIKIKTSFFAISTRKKVDFATDKLAFINKMSSTRHVQYSSFDALNIRVSLYCRCVNVCVAFTRYEEVLGVQAFIFFTKQTEEDVPSVWLSPVPSF